MKELKCIWIVVLVCLASITHAQNFIVLGGTLHTGNGEVIEHAAIFVENGIIINIADARLIRPDPSFGSIISAGAKHIYPGLIAAHTTLGLNEIDAIRPANDYTEVGEFTPHIRSLVAYNTDSRLIPTVRSNGILYSQIVPKGGLISGTSSVVSMEAWNWEDAVVKEGDGIHLWWPKKYLMSVSAENKGASETHFLYDGKIDRIKTFLQRAKAYQNGQHDDTDLVLAAMKGVFNGQQNLYVHAQGASEMISAIHLIKELEIPNMVIIGGQESQHIIGLLKEEDIPVILTCLHKLPPREHSDINHWYELPAILHDAGIEFCISYSGVTNIGYGSWENRSLPFIAGTAVAYGLDRETALAAISGNVASILGLDYSGTVVVGEEATFLISEGDLLDMRTSIVTHAWIKGKEVDLNDKQKALYEKFRGKYVEEGKIVE